MAASASATPSAASKPSAPRSPARYSPVVEDTGFFFDSELLIIAQYNGYRLLEVPVKWTDDPDSRVNVWRTAIADLKGLWRLRRGGVPAAVGASADPS